MLKACWVSSLNDALTRKALTALTVWSLTTLRAVIEGIESPVADPETIEKHGQVVLQGGPENASAKIAFGGGGDAVRQHGKPSQSLTVPHEIDVLHQV